MSSKLGITCSCICKLLVQITGVGNIHSICRRLFKLAKIAKFVLGRIENIVSIGENASYHHFLLYPQCFQKNFLRVDKSWDCVVKSNSFKTNNSSIARYISVLE